MEEQFVAKPGHKALAALSAVTMQLNKLVKQVVIEKAKELSGDASNTATRAMIKAIKAFPTYDKPRLGVYMSVIPKLNGWLIYRGQSKAGVAGVHVDWAVVSRALDANHFLVRKLGDEWEDVIWRVVDAKTFRDAEPEPATVMGGIDCEEPEFCKFVPNDANHYRNLMVLTDKFDAVYVKLDLNFKLPESCCLYLWPAAVDFDCDQLHVGPQTNFLVDYELGFIVILRKNT